MSHVAKIKLQIKDLAALKEAAHALGLEFAENQKTYKWFGQSVGDYPLPEGFTAADLGICEHALRIPGKPDAYEIGVARRKDGQGFELLWDFWQGGFGLREKIGDGGRRLVQEYSATVTERHYRRAGYRTTRATKNGRIVITANK